MVTVDRYVIHIGSETQVCHSWRKREMGGGEREREAKEWSSMIVCLIENAFSNFATIRTCVWIEWFILRINERIDRTNEWKGATRGNCDGSIAKGSINEFIGFWRWFAIKDINNDKWKESTFINDLLWNYLFSMNFFFFSFFFYEKQQ